jgi:hypothetical protein
MASIVKGVEGVLFGESYRRGGKLVNNLIDEDLSIIYEGPLELYTGLAWWTGFWKLVWRDDLKTQAMLLRFKHRDDKNPMAGKTSCILISCIRTLVPLEEHETQVLRLTPPPKHSNSNFSPASSSSASSSSFSSSSGLSKRVRSRFALETTDGLTLLLAAPSLEGRTAWMDKLYSILVSKASTC